MLAHVRDDLRDTPIGLRIADALRRQQLADRLTFGRGNDAHQSTILLSGYSTMPWPPAAFSFGIRSRTVRSSMMVLTATHSGSLSDDTVGPCSDGSSARIFSRSALR